MDLDYDWRFNRPAARLTVHMTNRRAGAAVFDATLTLERCEITGKSLAATLLRYPFATPRVLAGIYWQALRLRAKRIPFHVHPAKGAGDRST